MRGLGILVGALLAACAAAVWATTAQPSRIAFCVDTSPDGRSSRVYLAAPDGRGLRALSAGVSRDRNPAFHPQGTAVVYQSTNELGLDTLVVHPLDGGKPRTLAVGAYPQWSRDGTRILFARRQLNEFGLYTIAADGSQRDAGLKPFTRGQIGRWSPDEKLLAVVTPEIVMGQDRWKLSVLQTAGLQPRFGLVLPEQFGQVVSLDWAPDSQRLLFSVARPERYELYLVDLRAPEPKRLPAGEATVSAAFGSWSPDGEEILFRVGGEPPTAEPGSLGPTRLCIMKADGTQVRVLYEPEPRGYRLHGTAWFHPPLPPAPPPRPVVQEKPPRPQPELRPNPPAPKPPVRVLGPPQKVQEPRVARLPQRESPASVSLAVPGEADFVVTVPLLPDGNWSGRRQGVGFTLELSDGSLYRGTFIYSGQPWATIQGRPRGGKVRLIDGKQLENATGFRAGFKLTVRREGKHLHVLVNDQEVLVRPVVQASVRNLALTLENFDAGEARFSLGNVYYREWTLQPAEPGMP